MIPLRQLFRKFSASLFDRIFDYLLGPIPPKMDTVPAAAQPEPRLQYAAQTAAAAPARGEHRNPRSETRTPRRATPGATAELPLAAGKPVLRPLDHNIEHEGTVWIPRVLWALAWADLNNTGGKTAAELTKILEEQAGLAVRPNNFARAFRDLKTDSRAKGLWTVDEKRYTITPAGLTLLHEIVG